MPLPPSTKLGPYEIVSAIGSGGMGEVYRARDTRLGRDVAIKVLRAHLSSDAGLKARFDREAKAISGLNHPNICTLHDVGSQDGTEYLVMELVEGQTLAARLQKGPLPVEQVLKIGREIADALDKAHRNGIVHRDLKPGNIMLTKSGAKLLDFGLARPTESAATLATLTTAAPQDSPITEKGTIVGTFQYMSPEQVEGKELDGRSDIFSLGAVLYEMLTGKRAFEGKSQLSVASAILEKEPAPIANYKPLTPASLNHTILRCLAKDPEERWQTARDLASELKWNSESSSEANVTVRAHRGSKLRESLGWIAAVIAVIGLVASSLWWTSGGSKKQAMYFFAALPFPIEDASIAPNGHTAVVVAHLDPLDKSSLWIYETGSQEAKIVANTAGASFPFWSPDEKSIGFFADGKMKKVELASGQIQTLCDAPSGRGGTWNKDGVILFTPGGDLGQGISRMSAAGGPVTEILAPGKESKIDSYRWPVFLPDGKHFLFLMLNISGRRDLDAIHIGELDSKESRFVLNATANAYYASPGYIVFYRDNLVFAQKVDPKTFATMGEPVPLMADIQFRSGIGHATFTASSSGTLIVQNGGATILYQATWLDRQGKPVATIGNQEIITNPRLSQDGKSLLVSKTDQESLNSDLWSYDLQRGSMKRITFDPSLESSPVWNSDASKLIYASDHEHAFDLYLKGAGGAEQEKLILHDEMDKFPTDWSHDGKYVLYDRGKEMWYLTFPELKVTQLLQGSGTLKHGQFSPDGKWVAYASNESGRWEVYVTSFPETRGKWQISAEGGEEPRWRGDGKELFYFAPGGKLMATSVSTGNSFDSGKPEALFRAAAAPLVSTSDLYNYDVSKDGQKFLVITPIKQSDARPMSVLLNWPAKMNPQ